MLIAKRIFFYKSIFVFPPVSTGGEASDALNGSRYIVEGHGVCNFCHAQTTQYQIFIYLLIQKSWCCLCAQFKLTYELLRDFFHEWPMPNALRVGMDLWLLGIAKRANRAFQSFLYTIDFVGCLKNVQSEVFGRIDQAVSVVSSFWRCDDRVLYSCKGLPAGFPSDVPDNCRSDLL